VTARAGEEAGSTRDGRLGALLAARYGDAAVPPVACATPTIDLMLAHRSVRDYVPAPLPPGTLALLIAAAQSAATSSNMQSWSVVAVTDPARKNRLADLAQDQRYIRQCPLFLCFIADLSRAARVALTHDLTLETLPALETFLTAATDCALAAQNAALAAESLGLGTCMIGALRNRPEEVAALLGLPPRAFGIFGLCIGTPDPARPTDVKPRLPQGAVLHHEVYDARGEAAHLAAYDETLRRFGGSQRRSSKTWSQRLNDRLGELAGLNGRERLRSALRGLGFPLD
jgi:nitroreductase